MNKKKTIFMSSMYVTKKFVNNDSDEQEKERHLKVVNENVDKVVKKEIKSSKVKVIDFKRSSRFLRTYLKHKG